jgi:hypothetical protein
MRLFSNHRKYRNTTSLELENHRVRSKSAPNSAEDSFLQYVQFVQHLLIDALPQNVNNLNPQVNASERSTE